MSTEGQITDEMVEAAAKKAWELSGPDSDACIRTAPKGDWPGAGPGPGFAACGYAREVLRAALDVGPQESELATEQKLVHALEGRLAVRQRQIEATEMVVRRFNAEQCQCDPGDPTCEASSPCFICHFTDEALEALAAQSPASSTTGPLTDDDGPVLLGLREALGDELELEEDWRDSDGEEFIANDPAVEALATRISDKVKASIAAVLHKDGSLPHPETTDKEGGDEK